MVHNDILSARTHTKTPRKSAYTALLASSKLAFVVEYESPGRRGSIGTSSVPALISETSATDIDVCIVSAAELVYRCIITAKR